MKIKHGRACSVHATSMVSAFLAKRVWSMHLMHSVKGSEHSTLIEIFLFWKEQNYG